MQLNICSASVECIFRRLLSSYPRGKINWAKKAKARLLLFCYDVNLC